MFFHHRKVGQQAPGFATTHLASADYPNSFLPSAAALRPADSSPQSEGRQLSLFDRSFALFNFIHAA
jgi:hypothetical protein